MTTTQPLSGACDFAAPIELWARSLAGDAGVLFEGDRPLGGHISLPLPVVDRLLGDLQCKR